MLLEAVTLDSSNGPAADLRLVLPPPAQLTWLGAGATLPGQSGGTGVPQGAG